MDEYKTVCSERTLHYESKGFFKDFVTKVYGEVSSEEKEKLSSLKSREEKIKYVSQFPFSETLLVREFYREKSEKISREKRLEGNEQFAKGNYMTALQLYSMGIMFAPHEGENDDEERDLPLLLANRSACLYQLSHFRECIHDIDEAIDQQYPLHLVYKLYKRKGDSCLKLGSVRKAKKMFKESLKTLPLSRLSIEKKLLIKSKTEASVALLFSNVKTISDNNECDNSMNGKQMPFISSAIKISQSEDMGRYASASRDINVGEILVIEKPFVSVLLQDKCGIYCHHCFKRLFISYPCRVCSGVAFCSVQCRNKACDTYHRWECRYLNLIFGSGMSITCYMAFRVITQKDLHFFVSSKKIFGDRKISIKVSSLLPKRAEEITRYCIFYSLVSHSAERSIDDYLQRILMAIFLLKILVHSGFFSQSQELNDEYLEYHEKNKVYIGGLLLLNLEILQFNAHEIFEFQMKSKNNFTAANSVFIGAGIYLSVAFFNHSCDPGIVRYFKNDTIVVRSIKKVQKNEMIAENYGPFFARLDRNQRCHILRSRYWFDCRCQACNEDWPKYELLKDRDNILKISCQYCSNLILFSIDTTNSQVTCKKCSKTNNACKSIKDLAITDDLFREAQEKIVKGDIEIAVSNLEKAIQILCSYVLLPNASISLYTETLRKCYLTMGNLFVHEI